MVLTTAAAVAGEDIDLKAQQALVKGINCEVTGPKLRKAQEKVGCIFAELLNIAELTGSRNQLRRDDLVMTKYISDVADGLNPIRTMGTEPHESAPTYRLEVVGDGGTQNLDKYAGATCFKCGQIGHIRPTCPSTGPDKKLDPSNFRRKPNGSNNSNQGEGQRVRRGLNNRSNGNQSDNINRNGHGSVSPSGATVPSRMVSTIIKAPTTGLAADPSPLIVKQTTSVPSDHMQSEAAVSGETKGLDTAPVNAIIPEVVAPIGDIELFRIINTQNFLQHLDKSILQLSAHTFHTATGVARQPRDSSPLHLN